MPYHTTEIEIAGDTFSITAPGVFEYNIIDGDPSVGEPKGPMIDGCELLRLSLDGIWISRDFLVRINPRAGEFLISEANMSAIEDGIAEKLQAMLSLGELDQ